MPSSFASPRNPFPLVHIGLIVVLTLLLSGWTCRWDPLESTCRHASLSIL